MTTVTNERPNDAELLTLYDAIGWTVHPRSGPARCGDRRIPSGADRPGRLGAADRLGPHSVRKRQHLLPAGHPGASRRTAGRRRTFAAVLEQSADVRRFVLLTDDDDTQRAFYAAAGLVRSDTVGLHSYLRP